MNIYTLVTTEHETSATTDKRENMTMMQAYNIAKNGSFYKAQIINQENRVIEYEF